MDAPPRQKTDLERGSLPQKKGFCTIGRSREVGTEPCGAASPIAENPVERVESAHWNFSNSCLNLTAASGRQGARPMATSLLTKPAAKGGSFLLESPAPQDIFTPADLTDDQVLIGQTAEEFVTKEVFPLVKDLEAKKPGLMAELVRKGAELGLMSGGTPEEYGGAGLDKVATTVLTEKLSMYGGFAVTHGAHAGIGTLPIVYFGTEAQKKKYLPKLASGELIGAYCLSEPQAGSDAQNSLTRAELNKEGTHYILNGQKMWITN